MDCEITANKLDAAADGMAHLYDQNRTLLELLENAAKLLLAYSKQDEWSQKRIEKWRSQAALQKIQSTEGRANATKTPAVDEAT